MTRTSKTSWMICQPPSGTWEAAIDETYSSEAEALAVIAELQESDWGTLATRRILDNVEDRYVSTIVEHETDDSRNQKGQVRCIAQR